MLLNILVYDLNIPSELTNFSDCSHVIGAVLLYAPIPYPAGTIGNILIIIGIIVLVIWVVLMVVAAIRHT